MAGEQVRKDEVASHEPRERSGPVGQTVPGEPALDLHWRGVLAGSAGTPRPTGFMVRCAALESRQAPSAPTPTDELEAHVADQEGLARK